MAPTRYFFLALAITTASAYVPNEISIPAINGREFSTVNATALLASGSLLGTRQLTCPGYGQLNCGNGGCCTYNCCGSGCCLAGDICWNDSGDDSGLPHCCAAYTEQPCGNRCAPFNSECCGDGFYCQYGYKCISGSRCCKWGHTCTGGDDDYDYDSDYDSGDDSDSDTDTYVPKDDETSTYTTTTTTATATITEDETTTEEETSNIEESPSTSTDTEDETTSQPTDSSTSFDLDDYTSTPFTVSTAASAPTGSADSAGLLDDEAGSLGLPQKLLWHMVIAALVILV